MCCSRISLHLGAAFTSARESDGGLPKPIVVRSKSFNISDFNVFLTSGLVEEVSADFSNDILS